MLGEKILELDSLIEKGTYLLNINCNINCDILTKFF